MTTLLAQVRKRCFHRASKVKLQVNLKVAKLYIDFGIAFWYRAQWWSQMERYDVAMQSGILCFADILS